MLTRSPIPASSATLIDKLFSTGTDSPVRAASSIFKEATSNKRISAGTTSPASNMTISPGTNSLESISTTCPSRLTRATWLDISFKASMAASACPSVMSWRGTDGAKEAIARGFDAIMTPNSHLYFDYCQSENQDEEPLSNGGFISLEKVYSFNPYEGITEEMRSHIIGVQANLWTEYIPTNEQLEYMLLPRMLALSEVQWCRPEARDFDRFMNSMKTRQSQILEKAGYNYRKKY